MNSNNKYSARQIEYHRYLRSDKWSNKRRAVLQRFNYTCAKCGAKNTLFNVHHLTYKHIYNERNYELILLCERCHFQLHCAMDKNQHTGIIDCLLPANFISKQLVKVLLRIIHLKEKFNIA